MNQLSLYRIVKRKWESTAFDGKGAARFGGRWNSAGRPCVYAASSESLAILEMLVHLEDDDLLHSYSVLKITVDVDKVLELDPIPKNWQDYPASRETANVGDQWLDAKASLVLQVPSVVVPREHNFLINPSHPDLADTLDTLEVFSLALDYRLMK